MQKKYLVGQGAMVSPSDGRDIFLPHRDWSWITDLGKCMANK